MRDTSLQAYINLLKTDKLNEQEDFLYFVLCRNPNTTNNELEIITGMKINAISGRMRGLVLKNWVESNGKRICNESGNKCHQWTPKDRDDIKINIGPLLDGGAGEKR